jgi:hypothetical protein
MLRIRSGCLAVLRRDDAGGVAEHPRSVPQRRRRRPPAVRESRLEERTGVGPGREDGDRRHRPQSGRVEYKVRLRVCLENDVMRVLVLGNDLSDRPRWGLFAGPSKDVGKRPETLHGGFQGDLLGGREPGVIVAWDWTHAYPTSL